MTREEFNKTRFGAGMSCVYKENIYSISIVNFEEGLFALDDGFSESDDMEDLTWVRCESVDLVNVQKFANKEK